MNSTKPPLLRRSFSRLAVPGLVVATLGVALPLVTASSAAAYANCTYKTKSYYPGSALGPKVRYGEVELKFDICGDSNSGWSVAEDHWTNATGKVFGYQFDSVRVTTESSGTHAPTRTEHRTYKLKITGSTCISVSPVCTRSHGFETYIRVNRRHSDNYVGFSYYGTKNPKDMKLYTTP